MLQFIIYIIALVFWQSYGRFINVNNKKKIAQGIYSRFEDHYTKNKC